MARLLASVPPLVKISVLSPTPSTDATWKTNKLRDAPATTEDEKAATIKVHVRS